MNAPTLSLIVSLLFCHQRFEPVGNDWFGMDRVAFSREKEARSAASCPSSIHRAIFNAVLRLVCNS